MTDYHVFEAGDIALQSGMTLRAARLAYKTYGELDRTRSNAVLFPTRIQSQHTDNEFMIGEGKALDLSRYFIIVPNLFGNGLSSSPSNAVPQNRADFPNVTIYDNVMAQHRMVTEVLGVRSFALAVGFSMGAQQVYHWAALFPEMVKRLCVIAGSARTARHTWVFLEGMKAALTADCGFRNGWYSAPPTVGLRAIARAWAGWGFSQAFFREECYRDLGYASLEEFLVGYWERMFLQRDANNILAQIWTWQHSDISANPRYGGNFEAALSGITARAFVMPGQTDFYFPPEDSAEEARRLPNADLRVIPSIWGHAVGGGRNPADNAFIDAALRELLSEPA